MGTAAMPAREGRAPRALGLGCGADAGQQKVAFGQRVLHTLLAPQQRVCVLKPAAGAGQEVRPAACLGAAGAWPDSSGSRERGAIAPPARHAEP
eukprot:scaffold16594_cov124-Isochrysis_galbana.AAC.6